MEGPGTPSQCLTRIAPLCFALMVPSRLTSRLALATQVMVAAALGQAVHTQCALLLCVRMA